MNASEQMLVSTPAAVLKPAGLPIGSAVIGADGGDPIGVVDKVAISPATGELTHLLIRCLGERQHYILAPMGGVEPAFGGVVQLITPVAQLEGSAVARPEDDATAPVGRVAGHGYEPGQVLYTLAEPAAPLQDLSDAATLAQVAAVLESYGPTRLLLLDPWQDAPWDDRTTLDATIRVSLRNGVVILAGNVELDSYAGMAERLVRQVPGVREVLNLLLSDNALRTTLVASLHYDGRTRPLHIRVSVELGRVTLRGSVPDAGSRDAAGEVAAGVRGVRAVANQLRVAL